jgi:hypothetical protein
VLECLAGAGGAAVSAEELLEGRTPSAITTTATLGQPPRGRNPPAITRWPSHSLAGLLAGPAARWRPKESSRTAGQA